MKKIKLKRHKSKDVEPKLKKPRNIKGKILNGILILGITFISIILVFALYIIVTSPDFDKDKLYSKESSVLYYNDGKTELARLGNYDRVLVSYEQLPQVLIDAIVATEDSRFFQHSGLDVARFAKATAGQLLGQKGAGGASTLTMQLVKRAYTSSEDEGLAGIIRKFTDIYMAVFKIENNYTKEEIIEFYVNSQWFVNDGNTNYTGIAGVEQACQFFFGKSVSDISLAEASIIAGMFQNPYLYNPYFHTENLEKRQHTVLTLMVNHGYITEEQQKAVESIPIESLLVKRDNVSNASSQAAIDYVMSEVEKVTGYNPYEVPMKIVTTIDKDVQDVLIKLEKGELVKYPNEYFQEGTVITSMEDGSIVALSGGRNYSAKGTNRAVIKRQPGSTAKILFDYGPYIEYLDGSPSTLFLDEPTKYSNGASITNSSGGYAGLVTMRTALIKSINVPALKAFKAVYKENPEYISNFVHSLGIDYGEDLYEAMSIGGFDGISPVQMSAAYAAFGRGGYYIKPYSFKSATVVDTGKEYETKYKKEKVMSSETAYLITDMLVSAAKNGVGGVSVSGTTIAAKSGTSNVDRNWAKQNGVPTSATRDAWNVTYSPEYAIALWTGYDSTTKDHYLTVTVGNSMRKAIMSAVGSKVYSKNKKFSKPSGVVSVEIEKETIPTQLPTEFTPADLRVKEIFKENTEPTEVSFRFKKLDAPTNLSATMLSNGRVKLSWNSISTPDAINNDFLKDYFNENYENPTKYFENRISYNKSYIGNLIYNIYEKTRTGKLNFIDKTSNNYYTVKDPTRGDVTYVVKTSYSKFTANMSNGVEVKINTVIDSPIPDIIDTPTVPDNPDIPDNPNDNPPISDELE